LRLAYFSAVGENRVRPATKSLLVRYVTQEKRHEKNLDMGCRLADEHGARSPLFCAIADSRFSSHAP
jgi:hypothetical protein